MASQFIKLSGATGGGGGSSVTQGFDTIIPTSGTSPMASAGHTTLSILSGDSSIFAFGDSTLNTLDFRLINPIKDAGLVTSIDFHTRQLCNDSGNPVVQWTSGGLTLLDNSTNVALNWGNRQNIDSNTLLSLDWDNRQCVDSSGFQSISWGGGNRNLYDNSGQRNVDWANYQLIESGTVVLQWDNQTLIDQFGTLSIDWQNRLLRDNQGSNFPALDWVSRLLIDDSGVAALVWTGTQRQLLNSAGNTTLNWNNLRLLDGSGVTAVDWSVRTLNDSAGLTAFSWTTSGVVISKVLTQCNGINGQGGGIPVLVGVVSRINQTATITTTNIISSTQLAGLYHVDAILIVTTAGSAGTVSGTINYTDITNTAQTITLASILLTGLGNIDTVNQPIYPKSGTAITYAITVTAAAGTPKYNFVLGLKALF